MLPLLAQARLLVSFLLLLYLPPLLALSAVALVSTQTGIPMGIFMRDPTATAGIHPLTGAVSNFGALLWCASATICLFSWASLRHRLGETRFSRFLLYSAFMTILLLLDDLFLFHEVIFNRYFGVPEKMTFIGYGGLILCGMMMFKECILKTEYLILLIALGFFGLSLVVDAFQEVIEPFLGQWRILFEDGFKLLGIVGWFGYFSRYCFVEMSKMSREGVS